MLVLLIMFLKKDFRVWSRQPCQLAWICCTTTSWQWHGGTAWFWGQGTAGWETPEFLWTRFVAVRVTFGFVTCPRRSSGKPWRYRVATKMTRPSAKSCSISRRSPRWSASRTIRLTKSANRVPAMINYIAKQTMLVLKAGRFFLLTQEGKNGSFNLARLDKVRQAKWDKAGKETKLILGYV